MNIEVCTGSRDFVVTVEKVQLAARQERSSSAGVRRKGNVHAPVAQGSHPHAIVMQQKVEMKFGSVSSVGLSDN